MPLQVFCRNCAQYRNEWCKLKIDSPDPDMVRGCQYYRGMTNADRIRAMTDEELAELFEMIPHLGNPSTYTMDGFCIDDGLRTKRQWLDWLRKKAERDYE